MKDMNETFDSQVQRKLFVTKQKSLSCREHVCKVVFVFGQEINFSKGAWTTVKKKKACLKWQHFPLHPPSQLLHSRGFLRAHPTQQSQALLHMAQPGMEPLWFAECILILSH